MTEVSDSRQFRIKLTTGVFIGQAAFTVLVPLALLWVTNNRELLDQLAVALRPQPWAFALGLLLFIPGMLIDYLFGLIANRFSDDLDDKQLGIPDASLAVNGLRAFCVAFSEEFLTRGIIQGLFGIWVASILFGLGHIRGKSKFLRCFYTFSRGFLYGLVYMYTGSLWVTIVIHGLKDWLCFELISQNKESVLKRWLPRFLIEQPKATKASAE